MALNNMVSKIQFSFGNFSIVCIKNELNDIHQLKHNNSKDNAKYIKFLISIDVDLNCHYLIDVKLAKNKFKTFINRMWTIHLLHQLILKFWYKVCYT